MSKLGDEIQKGLKSTLYALDLPPAGKEAARAMIKNRVTAGVKVRTSEVPNKPISKTLTPELPKFSSSEVEQEITGVQNFRSSDKTKTPPPMTSELPKYARLEKFDAKLSAEQLHFLEQSEKTIMRNRHVRRERVTKNSIVRVLIDAFSHLKIDLQEIPDEEELKKRVFASCGVENR